jgi:hypothetical protein
MRKPEPFPGAFMHAAEAELNRMMMRQVFDFDQGYPILMKHVGAIVDEAARQRATGADDLDVLARTFNFIRERHADASPTMLMTLVAAFAVKLTDAREDTDTERNEP